MKGSLDNLLGIENTDNKVKRGGMQRKYKSQSTRKSRTNAAQVIQKHSRARKSLLNKSASIIQKSMKNKMKSLSRVESKIHPKSTFVVCSYWWGRGNVNKNSKKYSLQKVNINGKKVLRWRRDEENGRQLRYEELLKRLIDDCNDLGLSYYFEEYPNFAKKEIRGWKPFIKGERKPGKRRGVSEPAPSTNKRFNVKAQYQLGINFKAEFINTTLDKIKGKKLLYIDTDMRIESYPHLCDLDVDFMGYNWFNEVRDQHMLESNLIKILLYQMDNKAYICSPKLQIITIICVNACFLYFSCLLSCFTCPFTIVLNN